MTTTSILFISFFGMAAGNALGQPTITKQPADQSVSLGANVTFQTTATGAAPLNYQWHFNETEISGATNRAFILTNVQLPDAGGYTAVVTNVIGSVTSRVARLEVNAMFSKITTGFIVTNTATSWGAAWGDFDNDGFIDLVVSNVGADYLYRNNRDGTFIPITASPVMENDTTDGTGVAWADYDNDGNLDLVVGTGGGKNKLFRNNGDGTFTKTPGNAVVADGQSNSTIWGDYNNDGHVDLLVTSTLGPPNRLYRNNGDGSFTKMASAAVGNLASDGGHADSGTWGDYDNDGDLDVFITHYDAKNFFYRNNGDGTFTKLFRADTGDLDAASSVSGGPTWGDYDNDGDLDLFIMQGLSLDPLNDTLFRNNGDGTFTSMTSDVVGPLVNDHEHGQSCAWADYDNDGWLDLFVTASGLAFSTESGRKSLLYHNQGDGSFTQIAAGSPVNDVNWSEGGVWGDYDNDGFMDLFVANGGLAGLANGGLAGKQADSLFRNNGNSNGWLKLRLVGTLSNRAAIGAKVRVKATIGGKSFWQMREISGGDGFLSQNDLRPNFGLGDASVAETVRVEWPSGLVQELHGVASKQILTVTEPARLLVLGSGAFRIQSWKGMTFEVQASTDLTTWSPLTTITNLTGTLEFTDPHTGNDSRRFYRTVQTR
ncbi:MAG: FG-GAP-like repeat-containing protein [Verrucomicrobiales bacterium]|nr:FG-GAP-like repeat-containing protein [Verrucomicrobiales bacterium]